MTSEFIAPSYYKDFKCKGGDCRTCCCSGWAITVSRKEYFDLLSLPCSPALRYKIDGALHLLKDADVERYAQILPNFIGVCPMQREDGLCGLQCECGEENLPSVCRLYPRSVRLSPYAECCGSCSCEKVLEDLVKTDEKLTFEKIKTDVAVEGPVVSPPENYDKYRRECMEILEDRRDPLRRRLDRIFLLLNENDRFSGSVEVVAADVLELCRRSPSIGEECVKASKERKKIPDCVRIVAEKFPSVEIWVEKILSNHFFYEKFPFPERGESFPDVGRGLMGLCLLWLVLLADENVRSETDFIDITGKIFRVAEHTSFYKNVALLIRREEQDKI